MNYGNDTFAVTYYLTICIEVEQIEYENERIIVSWTRIWFLRFAFLEAESIQFFPIFLREVINYWFKVCYYCGLNFNKLIYEFW